MGSVFDEQVLSHGYPYKLLINVTILSLDPIPEYGI